MTNESAATGRGREAGFGIANIEQRMSNLQAQLLIIG
jgi:hypothetical protein